MGINRVETVIGTDKAPGSADEEPAEVPRSQQRRRILKAGTICFNGRHSTLACTVRDVSETGARLRVSGSISAPDTFELFIELDGAWVDCEVIWRRGTEIGVHFASPMSRETPKRKQVIQQQQTSTARPQIRRHPKSARTTTQ